MGSGILGLHWAPVHRPDPALFGPAGKHRGAPHPPPEFADFAVAHEALPMARLRPGVQTSWSVRLSQVGSPGVGEGEVGGL